MTVTETVTETVKSAVDTAKSAVGLDGTGASASREQMMAAKLPLQYRDGCAHLAIPLNKCRVEEYYLPWKCVDERHNYEKCQFADYMRRVAKQNELREQQGGRSN